MMNFENSNDIWVRQTLRLVQALLGAVSANFRMVALSREDNVWKLIFVLAVDSAEDRQEIDDVASEFEALQETGIEFTVDVKIDPEPIDWPEPPICVVYRRREP